MEKLHKDFNQRWNINKNPQSKETFIEFRQRVKDIIYGYTEWGCFEFGEMSPSGYHYKGKVKNLSKNFCKSAGLPIDGGIESHIMKANDYPELFRYIEIVINLLPGGK